MLQFSLQDLNPNLRIRESITSSQVRRERRAGAVPSDGWCGARLLRADHERARARREGDDGGGPAAADAADTRQRAGRGHGGRVGTAIRHADGVRWATCRVHGNVAGVQAADAV